MSPDSSRDRHVYLVVPRGTAWDVKQEGREEVLATDLARDEAVAVARSLAEASSFGQIIVHGADGLIEYESTCGKRSSWRPRGQPQL
jgi:uncharacterized protein DUF2188